MAEYKLTYHCDHVETITVEASNFEEAMYKFQNDIGETDWHIEGTRIIDDIEKEGKRIKVTDKIQKEYSS